MADSLQETPHRGSIAEDTAAEEPATAGQATEMSVDDLIEILGGFGRYQCRLFALVRFAASCVWFHGDTLVQACTHETCVPMRVSMCLVPGHIQSFICIHPYTIITYVYT
jgi:hypothetical protein